MPPQTTRPAQFYFLTYVDPPTYQILGNLKIVATGLLMRFALGRALTLQQWAALLLLTAGAATSQINTDCTAGAAAPVLHAPIIVSGAVVGLGARGCVGNGAGRAPPALCGAGARLPS